MKTEHIDVIYDLIRELASELDLHHEDPDFLKLGDTITVMQRGAEVLSELGRKAPSVYDHVLARHRHRQHQN